MINHLFIAMSIGVFVSACIWLVLPVNRIEPLTAIYGAEAGILGYIRSKFGASSPIDSLMRWRSGLDAARKE